MCWTRLSMLALVAVLTNCLQGQASPVLKTTSNGVEQTDSTNPAPEIVGEDINKENNLATSYVIDAQNAFPQNNAVEQHIDEATNAVTNGNAMAGGVQPALSADQLGPHQAVAGPSLKSLLLLSGMRRPEEEGVPDEVTLAFARRVLKAFFQGLKRRPELVDEILRRETYRLLLTSGIADNLFGTSPVEGLTQDLVTLPDMMFKDSVNSAGNGGNTPSMPSLESNTGTEDNQNAKRGAQTKAKLSAISAGDSSSAAAKGLKEELVDGLKDSVDNGHGAEATDSSNADSASNDLLTAPYYYYVYYDESEDTKPPPYSTGKDSDAQLTQSPSLSSHDKSADTKTETKRSQNQEKDKSDQPSYHGDGSGTAITNNGNIDTPTRSAVARDMEKEIARSQMMEIKPVQNGIDDPSTESKDQTSPTVEKTKVPTDEEIELSSLAV